MSVKSVYNTPMHSHVKIYNTEIKTYADGSKKIKYHSYGVVKGLSRKRVGVGDEKNRDYCRYKNLYKSKQKLIDLVYHNALVSSWEYFVTLTFDPKIVDSLDYECVSKALAKWIDNMKHQNPNMSYILVPELHKSGRIHWHGVFKSVPNWKLEPARNENTGRLIYKNGVKIYNLVNYKYGHTTVSEIQNQEAVSVYCSKYMTKDMIDLDYKKRYWSSRNLEKPNIEYAYFNEENLDFYIEKGEDLYRSENTISFKLRS